LPENFLFPFRQKSWRAFWQSWHSSLTQWLWNYIFNPLYLFFSRIKFNRTLGITACIFLVFAGMAFFNGLVSGYFISGALFALFYLTEWVFKGEKTKTGILSALLIFILFSIGLIFFRCPDAEQYLFLTNRLLDAGNFIPKEWLSQYFAPLASGGNQQDYFNLCISLVLCLLYIFFERRIVRLFSGNKIHFPVWIVLLLLLLVWGVFTNGERFIYMQF
jgi:alginate O-acetyltransferase complex protein AlgI